MFGPEYPGRPYRVLRSRGDQEFAGCEDEIGTLPPETIGKTMLLPLTIRQPDAMPRFSAIISTPETVGDLEEMGLPAGEGARLIRNIRPAAQIVVEMMNETRQLIQRDLESGARHVSASSPTSADVRRAQALGSTGLSGSAPSRDVMLPRSDAPSHCSS